MSVKQTKTVIFASSTFVAFVIGVVLYVDETTLPYHDIQINYVHTR